MPGRHERIASFDMALKQVRERCLEAWTVDADMAAIFAKYGMDADYFTRHYAGPVFDGFAASDPSGEGESVSRLSDYFRNRDMGLEDMHLLYGAFRRGLVASLLQNGVGDTALPEEALRRLDGQFAALLQHYNRALFQHEDAVREDLQRFREYQKVIDQSAIVSKTDRSGRITYANRAFREVSGYSEAELLGHPHSVIRHPDMDAGFFKELWETIQSKRIFRGIIKNRKKNGDAYYVDTTVVPILDTDNEIVEYIAMRHEITELVDALEAAKAAEKAKDAFLSNISHEIRTPLNAIMGFVAILQKRAADETSRHYLNIIASSGRTLIRIINDILDFSKIRSGKFGIHPHPCNPVEELSATVQLFASGAYEKRLGYYTYIDPHLPARLEIDSVRIRQIVANLLSNAIKFSAEGGSVKFKAVYEGGALVISVQDRGIGIAPEQRNAVFNAFEQADGSITRHYGGTGLGMAISSQLASLMGGTLGFKSVPKRGSVFTLKIPASARMQNPGNGVAGPDAEVTVVGEEGKEPLVDLAVRYLKAFGTRRVRYVRELPDEEAENVLCSAASPLLDALRQRKGRLIVLLEAPSHDFDDAPGIHLLTSPILPGDVLRMLKTLSHP